MKINQTRIQRQTRIQLFAICIFCCLIAGVDLASAAPVQGGKTIEVPATVRGIWSVDVYSKVGGYVEEINVDIGDEFKSGEVLVKLNIPELQGDVLRKEALLEQSKAEVLQAAAVVREAEAKLQQAEASVDEARSMRLAKDAMVQYETRELARINRLVQSDSVSPELVDKARLGVEAAKADLETVAASVSTARAGVTGAKAHIEKSQADLLTANAKVTVAKSNVAYSKQLLDYATIKAPWDGMVIDRSFDVGGFVQNADGNSAAQPLLKIARVDRVRVAFKLSSSDVRYLKKGDRAVLGRIDALKGEEFEGKVTRFSAGMDEKTKQMKVEVELRNPEGKLKPGYFGYVKIFPN